jgi:glycerate-2-kinase
MGLAFSRDWPERAPIVEAFTAALDAVDPELAVRTALRDRPMEGPLTVVSIGKAAAAMARGVPGAVSGVVVSDHAEPVPDGFATFVGAHPIPDDTSLAAGRAVISVVEASDGPILFLISGGSSALCEVPVPGLTIEDLAGVTGALLRSGADIGAMNTVRKHLSSLKGGRLAVLAAPRVARTLVMSDVVGDPLDTIGSGPTVPDPTTYGDAVDVLERLRIRVPEAVAAVLAAGSRGEEAETPKGAFPGHRVEVVANAAVAARAAAAAARQMGIAARVGPTDLQGDTETAATAAVTAAAEEGMTFFAGETTVEVTGGGVGGRNQHAALAAALVLDGGDDRLLFGTLATDGVDGPTDAAGAVVDSGTVGRGRSAGLDALAYFSNHASHPFLEASGDLLRIGPSGTNVGDLWVLWAR